MRTFNFLVFIFLIYFLNCARDKSPINFSHKNTSQYFPLNVGNTWFYDSPTPQTNPWAMRTIKSSFKKNNTIFYTLTYGEGVDVIDNIRLDKQGNIWKLINDIEYLWFDFTQDSGSTYIYNSPESFGGNNYYYKVYVKKNISIETPAGFFENCMILFFDILQVRDEEISYTFAPDIGIIRIVNYGWSTKNLNYAIIQGDTIGIR